MAAFEVLPGLPPYGPAAKPFPVSGYRAHSQGFVVQFLGEKAGTWVGNFQPGLTSFSGAYEHPDGRHIVVVSGGDIYVVDPDTKTAENFGGMVEAVTPLPEKNALLFAENIYLSLIGPRGPISERYIFSAKSKAFFSGSGVTASTIPPKFSAVFVSGSTT